MPVGLDPNLPLPEIVETDFIIPLPALSAVEFAGFKVDHAEPKPAHFDFIKGVYVPFLIQSIEALNDPRMKSITLHLRGLASATGSADRNLKLSVARAAAIGEAIRRQFDVQKRGSALANGVAVVVDAKGLGDVAAKHVLDDAKRSHPGVQFSNKAIDGVQGGFRSAIVSLRVVERPPDSDRPVYHCRQIFVFNLKKEKVPVNQLVDELERLKRENPTITLVVGLAIDQAIEALKVIIDELAKDLPFLTLLKESLEFIIPSDVAQCFDFKDPRGQQATYSFFGNENRKSLSLLGAVAKILKIGKFFAKLQKLVEAERRIKNADAIVKLIAAAKKVFDSLLKNATGKGSPIRSLLGDTNTEFLLDLLREEGSPASFVTVPTSKPFAFQFKKPGFFDVHSFGSFAQTIGHDVLLTSELTLSFGATDLTGISGFEAEVTITTDFSIRNALLSFGIAHGRIALMPQIHP